MILWKLSLDICFVKFVIEKRRVWFTTRYVSINGNHWKGMTEWEKRSFQKSVFIWARRKARWHSYWVLPLKPSRVLNRVGGIFQCILNGRSSFFRSWRTHPIRRWSPAGCYKHVPWRQGEIAQLGNFKLDIFVGLLMGQSVMARCRKVGRRRWKYVGNAICSRAFYPL